MHNILLKKILKLTKSQKEEIRKLRNSTYVNSQMYNDHVINKEEHANWLQSLKTNKNKCVFGVLYEINNQKKVLGLVSLNNINLTNKQTEWAFYIKKKNIFGLGPALEFNLIDFVFKNNFNNLLCEVLISNESVINLHKKFFFIKKNIIKNIKKNNKFIKVITLQLDAKTWFSKKKFIAKKFDRIFRNFNITIDEL